MEDSIESSHPDGRQRRLSVPGCVPGFKISVV
jgi:hypothetical protein